ncbi:MAG: ATP-dependent helicase UvrD/PcrA [Candidatus Cloacimonadota bacterium]|jgi:DNA helicase-2/ATP-dependent DNA helicase PcrA|nr:ATP-dependent helicase UvrD/PcrA [Candidatus Cloacimonadota bacterium]
MQLLENLNKEQQQVVTTTEGPLLVLAGAGSGKTRSVIYRTAYLISEKHISPWNILVVTFTNKAARELINRLEINFGINTRSLWIGTFHSICSRILRYESALLPYDSNFSIYDDADQKTVFKKIYKELDIDKKFFSMGAVRNIISRQKNSLILPDDFFKFNEKNYYTETVHKIYNRYQKYLEENNAMDFDDLLLNTAYLLHDHSQILKKYQQKFRYVMIDEYQDTNYAQFKIVNLIASAHQNLCVVGDDDQAIYSWRGADIRNILNFEKDYKNVKTIKLERNYRSPKIILNLANSLIKYNDERHPKELWTSYEDDAVPILKVLQNERAEASFVADQIRQLQENKISLNSCVVLYRTNAQSRIFESTFVKYGIKYQIVGGVNFYQRKEIKDIIAYLRILVNPSDSESFLRIINYPSRGIGKSTMGKIIEFAFLNNITLLEAINSKIPTLSKWQQTNVNNFAQLTKSWQQLEVPLPKLVQKILDDLGLIDQFKNSKDPQEITRAENLQEFISACSEFYEQFLDENKEEPTLAEYLQNIALQTDLDNLDPQEESVKLMTMHNAKGLEFDYVFIVGLEEGLLPHSRSMDTNKELQEERRLLYVAITRTKKQLFMSYAKNRNIFGDSILTMPSHFIKEMDERFYKKEVVAKSSHINFDRKIVLESSKHFQIGDKVFHKKFGKGIILNVDGKDVDAKLTISFSGGKLKKIIGSYVTRI